MSADATITVEVAYARPEQQELVSLSVPAGTTVIEAVRATRFGATLLDEQPELQLGVWGRVTAPDRPLKNGERVEIYRPLDVDPRRMRRELAKLGQTMAGAAEATARGSG